MPLNATGGFTNWTTQNATATAGGIVNTISTNIPWAFTFILFLFYIIMFIYLQDDPDKRKYIYITFVGMIASIIMELLHLVPTTVVMATTGFWILTMIFVLAS